MCEWNKNCSKRIDPCIKIFIKNLKMLLNKTKWKPVGSCCGHGKYHLTVVLEHKYEGNRMELFSGVVIPRKKKSYKKDSKGMYFIPEVENA